MDGFPPSALDALLLASRKLRRIMPDAVRHADSLQSFHHPSLAIGGRHSLTVGQRQFDILVRQIPNQVETLEDEANLLIADARPLCEV
jgi:hypothetical protein